MGKGRETSAAAAAMGKGRETASASAMGKRRETSVCLRVVMDGFQRPDALLWYVVNLSDSPLQPCSKKNVRRMEKEANRRIKEYEQKYDKAMKRKFSEVEEKEDSDPLLNPVWQTEGIPEFCFWTVRGSTVYCLGGRLGGKLGYGKNFRAFDILDASNDVNVGPPMMMKRMDGKAVTALNRIFVFGGEKPDRSPWGEVLEIKQGAEWKAVSEPPWRSDYVLAFPLEDGVNGIIVCSCSMDGLLLYNIYDDSWKVVDKKFSFYGPSFTEPVFVSRSIYWIGSDECMYSYDLDAKELCRGDVDFAPLKDALDSIRVCRMSYQLPFLHLHDDVFCLIWVDGCSSPRSAFVFHKMRLSKSFGKKKGYLRVKPVSTEYFLTNQESITWFDGLVL